MIGERIRVARARAQMTLRGLGADIGVSAQAVKNYENNKCMPRSSVLIKICERLDVSAEWLLAGEPLDFHSTDKAPQGRHAKYWVREALDELSERGLI